MVGLGKQANKKWPFARKFEKPWSSLFLSDALQLQLWVWTEDHNCKNVAVIFITLICCPSLPPARIKNRSINSQQASA